MGEKISLFIFGREIWFSPEADFYLRDCFFYSCEKSLNNLGNLFVDRLDNELVKRE